MLAFLLLVPGLLGLLGGFGEDEIQEEDTSDIPAENPNPEESILPQVVANDPSPFAAFSLETFSEPSVFENENFVESENTVEEEQTFERTGQIVSDGLFGTNAVYTIHTNDGELTDDFERALETFEIEGLRFPAGEAEPKNGGLNGWDGFNITRLTEDGELSPELTTFLDAADGRNVTLTIPTAQIDVEVYGERLEEWAEIVMNEYGDVVTAFEVGNEYWALMDETEYGSKANIAVKALQNGIVAADAEDADILVQMASPFSESEYNSSVDDRGFRARLTDANEAILAQLDDEAREAIGGVVEHYYWNEAAAPFTDSSAEVNYINLDLAIWEETLDRDLDLHITEWNIKASNIENNGVKSMGVLVEMVENMVELDVVQGAVWPIVHNTANDLGGPLGAGTIETDDEGRVVHTVRGAMFDLMSKSLPGMELIQLDLESVENDMELAAYEKDDEFVVYIGNNSEAPETIIIDLNDLLPNFNEAQGVKVGYDRATSNGLIYSSALQAVIETQSVSIDGENYHLNEHGTGAVLTDYNFDSSLIEINLNPYEVMQITAR
ncbi:hypothetical protein N8Y41_00460 [bacterium]|nr:hypothetical protein [bacterium]